MNDKATVAEQRRCCVEQFVHCLVTAALNRQLHAHDSDYVRDSLQDLVKALSAAAHAGVEMPLQLQLSDDRIHFDGKPLDGSSLQARSLLRRCAERHIAGIAFHPGLQPDELNRVFDLLLLPHNKAALHRRHRERALRALAIRHVQFSSRTPGDPGNRRIALPQSPDTVEALHRYQDLAECLQDNHVRAHADRALRVDAAAGLVERTLSHLEREPSSLLSLAAQDNIDRFTVGHSVRVALLSLQVARAAGAAPDQLVHVGTAALLHDIGKSKVPQEILFKQSRLSDEEWHWMAQHPRLGAQILLEQGELDPSAVGAAFCHHMRPDGDGYPIPSLPISPSGTSRLIRVCDVFEALTAVRPYKRALTPIEAYAVMFRNECDFDQRWLRLFVRTLGLYPLGTRVLLDDGAHALVIAQGSRPDRPRVRLLTAANGDDLLPGQPDELAIGTPHEGRVRQIAAVTTHDRCVRLPALDADRDDIDGDGDGEVQILTQSVHHACLPMAPARSD